MKNVFITIFIFTTIISAGFAVYFGLELKKGNDDKINSSLSDQNYSEKDVESTESNLQDKILDISKNLNEGVYLSKTFENTKTKIQNGKAYVSFTTNELGSGEYTKELNKYYEILNVKGNVIDISRVTIPTSKYPIFILLMDDGTVQKTKFSKGSDIICDGKIDGLENIVRIDEVEIVNKLEFGENVVDSYSTGVVATNKNGDTTNIKVEY